MATTANKHLANRYGYCVNEKCEMSKKDAKGKNQVQTIPSHKPLICSECQKPLHECPPVKENKIPWKLIGIIVAAILLLGGIGLGIWKLTGSTKIEKIRLDKKELVLTVGETAVITPKAEPEGVKATFIFKRKGKNIEVNSGGEVRALKKGDATVLVKCEENPEVRALCKVKVEEQPVEEPEPKTVYVQNLSIEGGDFSLKEGETKQLTKTVSPEEHDELISWESDNENVAIVDVNGKVTAKSEGSANIILKTDKSGKSANVKVMVTKKPGPEPIISPIEHYGTYVGSRNKKNGWPDGSGKLTFTRAYQLNAEYTAQPGEYITGIFENGKPSFVTYYKSDGTVVKIKTR